MIRTFLGLGALALLVFFPALAAQAQCREPLQWGWESSAVAATALAGGVALWISRPRRKR